MKNMARLFDLFALIASFILAGVVAYSSVSKGLTFDRLMGVRITLGNCFLFALLLFTWHILFDVCGLYISKRLTMGRAVILEVCKATLLASAVLLASARAFHIGMVNGRFTVLFCLSCTALMVFGRFAARNILLVLRRRGKNTRFLLVVGTNARALDFANQVTNRLELGYRLAGFVDDDWAGIAAFEASGYKRCCTFPGLADFLRHNVVDEAAIFLPLKSYYEHAAQLVSLCEEHGIGIRFNQQVFNLRKAYQDLDLDEHSLVRAVATSTEAWPSILKRVLDVVISALLLVAVAPVFAVVAVVLKFTSPGPLFFGQLRMGLNKRQFKMYKFRTMVANAEQLQEKLLSMNEMSGPAFKIKNDPRVTPIGRILRKTSIDELPQLVNVLMGDMSLVGPRAMSLRDYGLFEQDWQRRRFCVKPGITCLWQVNGRSTLAFEQWMELDMQYIDKWSLWLDFKILALTVPAVLRGTGAT